MSDLAPHDALILRLASDLRPVRTLPRPSVRAGFWLAGAGWLALLLSFFTDFTAFQTRMMAKPDMWLSEIGAVLTAALGALAAFETSVPGRSSRWALLPLPAFLLWVGASTAGCLRLDAIPGTRAEPAMHPAACLSMLLVLSLPLAGLLIFLLLRACPLRPGLTATLGGIASAGAACALLSLVHPFDATALDLGVHLLAVLAVVELSRQLGGRALGGGGL